AALVGGLMLDLGWSMGACIERYQHEQAKRHEAEQGYARQMISQAEQFLAAGDVESAERTLESIPAEFRGLEWRLLRNRREPNEVIRLPHNAIIVAVAYQPGGSRVVGTAGIDGAVK